MKSKNNLYFAILIGIILIMGYFMIFGEPGTAVESFEESILREEIRLKDSTATHWEEESASWQNLANNLGDKNDSLANLKPVIQHHYDKKYTFNANASTTQLDSVIRASW